ncbi:MAG: hypothetical protein OIF54_05205 [Cohaesibacter sp.]|nr:hypothetical protein [Cohaesibacter sp.]
MTLIDDTRAILTRLAQKGWLPVFHAIGVDPQAEDLRSNLLTPIVSAAGFQSLPGFEDLALDASQPIHPGSPARSLLYHALASPSLVTSTDGTPLEAFPTAADLDIIENLVFGIQPIRIADILSRFAGHHIAVGVFAREYRSKATTTHAHHADMVYSRCGISRVGTLPEHWDGRKRAYSPLESGDDPFAFRTLPCRYGVYIAVQMMGDAAKSLPFKFDRTFDAFQSFSDVRVRPQAQKSDAEEQFWVPVHKLFSGTECLLGHDLDVSLLHTHINQKLKRIHAHNLGQSSLFDSGFEEPQISNAPFKIDQDLAAFLSDSDSGPGVLNAVPKTGLVERTVDANGPIGVNIPPNGEFDAAFNIPALGRAHRAPEYVHARLRLQKNGKTEDLNKFEGVKAIVDSGRVGTVNPYTAQHFTDFTADGWISADLSGAPSELDRHIPAYSIVAAPDFYPYVSQSDLLDWSMNVRSQIRRRFWRAPPLALCDQRSAPNLRLREDGAPFVPEDKTISAMVGLTTSQSTAGNSGSAMKVNRTTYMPDGAAGFYAPGWDTSTDIDEETGELYLAAYGLGSPFPEDAKLCAAISAFWPAVAPDTARSYGAPGRPPIAPMVDSEIGIGGTHPWDGVQPPHVVVEDGTLFLEEENYMHIDYVKSAEKGLFTMAQTMLVDQETYQARILATHRMFMMLEQVFNSSNLRMLSFARAASDDGDLLHVRANILALKEQTHKFSMVQTDGSGPLFQDSADNTRWLKRSRIRSRLDIMVDDIGQIAFRLNDGDWQAAPVS